MKQNCTYVTTCVPIFLLWPLLKGDMKVCLPEEVIFLKGEGLFTRRSHISQGWSPREIWLLRVNKASYLPTARAINCLLYQNYTHNNKTFFFTIETWRVTTLCVLPVGVTMGACGSGMHDIYFPRVCDLGIDEVLSSWHVMFFLANHKHSYIYEV